MSNKPSLDELEAQLRKLRTKETATPVAPLASEPASLGYHHQIESTSVAAEIAPIHVNGDAAGSREPLAFVEAVPLVAVSQSEEPLPVLAEKVDAEEEVQTPIEVTQDTILVDETADSMCHSSIDLHEQAEVAPVTSQVKAKKSGGFTGIISDILVAAFMKKTSKHPGRTDVPNDSTISLKMEPVEPVELPEDLASDRSTQDVKAPAKDSTGQIIIKLLGKKVLIGLVMIGGVSYMFLGGPSSKHGPKKDVDKAVSLSVGPETFGAPPQKPVQAGLSTANKEKAVSNVAATTAQDAAAIALLSPQPVAAQKNKPGAPLSIGAPATPPSPPPSGTAPTPPVAVPVPVQVKLPAKPAENISEGRVALPAEKKAKRIEAAKDLDDTEEPPRKHKKRHVRRRIEAAIPSNFKPAVKKPPVAEAEKAPAVKPVTPVKITSVTPKTIVPELVFRGQE